MVDNSMFPSGMNSVNCGNAYDPNKGMDIQRAPVMQRQDVPVPTSGGFPVVGGRMPWVLPEGRLSQQNPEPKSDRRR